MDKMVVTLRDKQMNKKRVFKTIGELKRYAATHNVGKKVPYLVKIDNGCIIETRYVLSNNPDSAIAAMIRELNQVSVESVPVY